MKITHSLSVDLQHSGSQNTIYAKQGDSLTRAICFSLYDGGTEFTVPAGTILQIAYAKQDGKGGLYDTMPDGTAACSASGNTVTAKLHPQMFTVAGIVACELRLLSGAGEQLSTFSWFIAVQASATAGITSEDYYRFATLDGVIADIGDLSKLATTAKSNLVAAINEVLGKVATGIVKTVNQLRPNARGDVQITAKDILTSVQALQYQGSIDGALNELAGLAAQFDPSQADMLRRFADKAEGVAEGDSIGVPVINSRDGVAGEMALAMVNRSAAEEQTPDQAGNVTIPTEGRVMELVEQAGTSADIAGEWDNVETIPPTKDADGYIELGKGDMSMTLPIPKELATVAYVDGLVPLSAQGRVDVTEQYAAWTPTAGIKTVAEFAKTLADGSYRLTDDYLWLIDTMTVQGTQWRILREYDDEFCYFDAYCGGLLAFSAESETGRVSAGGRALLTDDNIPLPATADAGKVLTVSASGRAQWTAVTNAEEVAV